mgnify:CR=1 FL=1
MKVLKVTIIKFLCEHIMTKLNFSEHSRKSTIAESIMLSNQQKLQKNKSFTTSHSNAHPPAGGFSEKKKEIRKVSSIASFWKIDNINL